MTSMSQCDRILRHLKDYGAITSLEAMQEYGILRLSGRIYDLRAKGYPITSAATEGRNRYGEKTYYVTYRLEGEHAEPYYGHGPTDPRS